MAFPARVGILIHIAGMIFKRGRHRRQQRWTTGGAKSSPLAGGGNFVPQEKLSMRKIREVLRLRFGLGLPQDQIARSCSISQATVHRYLERAAATALSWPLPEDCDDRHLQQLLLRGQPGRPR